MDTRDNVLDIRGRRSEAPGPEMEDRPLGAYATLSITYNAVFAIFLLLARRTGRTLPERVSFADIALLGLATHKLARLISKDMVTSSVRAPFVDLEEQETGEIKEKPRGEGLRHAVGYLLTCPFCVGQWVATFFMFGLVFTPRTTRFLAGTFSTVALADFLHYGLEWSRKRAEE